MRATLSNKAGKEPVGASLFVPSSTARDLYEVLLDVRGFPRWAPGIRRVEVVEGPVGTGMVSGWQVSVLGVRRKVSSILVEAEAPRYLRWTYDGMVSGWGECVIEDLGCGVLAGFRTELRPTEPGLHKLARSLPVQDTARVHLKRCLARFGREVAGDGAGVRVGPLRGNP